MSVELRRLQPQVSGLNSGDVEGRIEVNPVEIKTEDIAFFSELFAKLLRSETGAVKITFGTEKHVDTENLKSVAESLTEVFGQVGISLNTVVIPMEWQEVPQILVSFKK